MAARRACDTARATVDHCRNDDYTAPLPRPGTRGRAGWRERGGAGVNGILKGLRVVEGSAFVAAPLGGMTLAQMGADVIRFDPLGGGLDYRRWPVTAENESIYWAGMNKGKRSFAVNLREAEGRELVAALIAAPGPEAGIFLTNLQVGDWLSYETLRARRADLIMLRIIGNPDGTVAVDYTVNARMGWPYVTGPEELDGPVNNVLPGWDLTCGLTAAIGLLAAERHRSRTGEGQEIRLSLADVAYHITGSLGYIGDVEINDAERPRIGNDMYGTFGGDFATGDGRRIMLVVVTPRHVRALGQATGLARTFAAIEAEHGVNLADEADRWQVRSELRAALEPWFASLSLDEVGARLTEAGVLWGPFRTHGQMVAEDPFCSTENPLFQRIDQPGIGPVLTPGSPLDFAAAPRGRVRPGPRLGEHTDEILAGVLGLGDGTIGALHDRGIVAGPAG